MANAVVLVCVQSCVKVGLWMIVLQPQVTEGLAWTTIKYLTRHKAHTLHNALYPFKKRIDHMPHFGKGKE